MNPDEEKPGSLPEKVSESAPEPPGSWMRLVLVFTSPGRVFDAIRIKPTWAACLLVIVLVAVPVQWMVSRHMDLTASVQERMERQGKVLTEEQREKIEERIARFQGVIIASTVVALPIGMLVLAAVYLTGMKLGGAQIRFDQAFSTTLHATLPGALSKALVTMVVLSRVGKMTQQAMQQLVKSNPAAFLPADAPRWLVSLGTTFDVFNIWTFILLVMGFSIAGGIRRKRSTVIVGSLWALYLIVKVGIALLFKT